MWLIRPTLASASTMLLGLTFLGMSTTANAADNNDGCTITTTTNGNNNHITNACGRITYGDNAVNGSGHTVTTGLGQLGAPRVGTPITVQSSRSGLSIASCSSDQSGNTCATGPLPQTLNMGGAGSAHYNLTVNDNGTFIPVTIDWDGIILSVNCNNRCTQGGNGTSYTITF